MNSYLRHLDEIKQSELSVVSRSVSLMSTAKFSNAQIIVTEKMKYSSDSKQPHLLSW